VFSSDIPLAKLILLPVLPRVSFEDGSPVPDAMFSNTLTRVELTIPKLEKDSLPVVVCYDVSYQTPITGVIGELFTFCVLWLFVVLGVVG
jgi:hypothetical protein